jgi:allantoicase
LSIYPDGGVARLRVHGEVVPDPAFLTGTADLAAMENGGRVVGCSDAFYSSPSNLILPGLASVMGEGWENARRRGPGNDFVVFRLASAGRLRRVDIDTSYFVGNAPGWIELSGAVGAGEDDLTWRPVLARTRVQPDTRHQFLIAEPAEVTHLRLDVFPDGGLARFRAYGEVTEQGYAALAARWQDTTP